MQYISLSAFSAQMAGVVDFIIRDGIREKTEDNWATIDFELTIKETSLEELYERFDTNHGV